MKKICLLSLVLLFAAYSISAAQSWIGFQTFTSTSRNNPALAVWGVQLEGETSVAFRGINIGGTIYPVKKSPFGLGFQVGASEIHSISSTTPNVDLSEYPLAWRGGLSGHYHTHLFGNLSMELGAGVLAERMHKAVGSGNAEIRATLNAISLLCTANVLLPLSETFSIVGGITSSLPLYTQRKISRGDNADKANIDVEGITVQAQIGISLAL